MRRVLFVTVLCIIVLAAGFSLLVYRLSRVYLAGTGPVSITPHMKPVGAQGDTLVLWSNLALVGTPVPLLGTYYSLAVRESGEFVDNIKLYASLADYTRGSAPLSSYPIKTSSSGLPWSLCASPHDFRAWSNNAPGDQITFISKTFSFLPIFRPLTSSGQGSFTNYSTHTIDAKLVSLTLNVQPANSPLPVSCAAPTPPPTECSTTQPNYGACTITCKNYTCLALLDY